MLLWFYRFADIILQIVMGQPKSIIIIKLRMWWSVPYLIPITLYTYIYYVQNQIVDSNILLHSGFG